MVTIRFRIEVTDKGFKAGLSSSGSDSEYPIIASKEEAIEEVFGKAFSLAAQEIMNTLAEEGGEGAQVIQFEGEAADKRFQAWRN